VGVIGCVFVWGGVWGFCLVGVFLVLLWGGLWCGRLWFGGFCVDFVGWVWCGGGGRGVEVNGIWLVDVLCLCVGGLSRYEVILWYVWGQKGAFMRNFYG
jgi:hypothetical protein